MNGPQRFRTELINHYKTLAVLYSLAEPFLAPLKRRISEILAETPGPILDVACGRGTQGRLLADSGRFVVGIDLSRAMLRGTAKDLPCSGTFVTVEGDGASLPFRDDTFAGSIIALALHEMPPEVAVSVVREMKRVVRPGGLIIAADFRESLPWLVKAGLSLIEPRHFQAYTRQGVTGYLREADLNPRTLSFHLFRTVALTVSVKAEG